MCEQEIEILCHFDMKIFLSPLHALSPNNFKNTPPASLNNILSPRHIA